jgi:hypothetical protein
MHPSNWRGWPSFRCMTLRRRCGNCSAADRWPEGAMIWASPPKIDPIALLSTIHSGPQPRTFACR